MAAFYDRLNKFEHSKSCHIIFNFVFVFVIWGTSTIDYHHSTSIYSIHIHLSLQISRWNLWRAIESKYFTSQHCCCKICILKWFHPFTHICVCNVYAVSYLCEAMRLIFNTNGIVTNQFLVKERTLWMHMIIEGWQCIQHAHLLHLQTIL